MLGGFEAGLLPKEKAGAGDEAGVVDPPPPPKLPKSPPPVEEEEAGAGGLAGVVEEEPKEKAGVEVGAALEAGWPNSPPEAGGWLVSAL